MRSLESAASRLRQEVAWLADALTLVGVPPLSPRR